MSVRHEFTPAAAVTTPGGLTVRAPFVGTGEGAPTPPARAAAPPRHDAARDRREPPGPTKAPSADRLGFEGPPDAAKAADAVCVTNAGAGVIAALGLAVPAFWIAFVVSLALGNSLLAALLTGWSIGTLAALAIPVCMLMRPRKTMDTLSPDTDRIARPVQPRRKPYPLP